MHNFSSQNHYNLIQLSPRAIESPIALFLCKKRGIFYSVSHCRKAKCGYEYRVCAGRTRQERRISDDLEKYNV